MAVAKPPAGLGAAGKALWQRLTAPPSPGKSLVFTSAEILTLELAARTADDVAALEKLLAVDGLVVTGSKGQRRLSPVAAELRLQRAALARLVGLLALPDADEVVGKSAAQRKAQRAADARWAKSAQAREGRRRGQTG